MRLRTRKALGAAAVLAAAAAVAAPGSQSRPTVGGTYRVGVQTDGFGVERLPWSDGLDPTGEFRREAFAIYSNLVLRTLVGYDHVAGAAGYKLVPDLAVSVPQAADRGRSYAFTLKSGVRFGPPVDREITSRDVRYAVERLARPRNGSLYARTFDVIRGFDAYRAGKAPSISGIATPNKRTIRFTLTRATGDFPHRLTMPGTAPIPPEVGKCFEGRPGEYGRDLISSGPYMIQGSKAIRIGSCSAIRPMAGISDAQLVLVRNPSYDAKTDSRAARENSPDRFVFVASTSPFSILTKLEAGELEDSFLTAGPKVVGKYAERAKRRGLLHVDSADWVFWITMNLTRPPFDDVHVRRAMNWVLDRAALQDAWGGPAAGPIAQHVVPDLLLGNRLERFAPFKTPGDHGDLARARAELARSKYANRGGVCTAKACKGIHITGFLGPGFGPYAAYPREFASLVFGVVYAPSERMAPILKAAAARLGLTFKEHLGEAGVPADNVPISQPENWYKSYSDPASYLEPLFAGDGIVPRGGFNFSLVGLTPAQAAKLHVQGRVTGVPSVDADLARCGALLGSPRFDCYAALDRKLTTQVVPWIPVLSKNQLTILGPQVANWRFDQATGVTALAHVALKR